MLKTFNTNLCNLNFSKATEYAIKAYNLLPEKKVYINFSEDDRFKLSTTYFNLAYYFQTQNNFSLCEEISLLVLEIQKRLVNQNPEKYNPTYTTTINNLGCLYKSNNKPKEAEEICKIALKIHKRLSNASLEHYANTANNLGCLYGYENINIEKAKEMFQIVLEIYCKFVDINSSKFKPILHQTFSNYISFINDYDPDLAMGEFLKYKPYLV